jgi:carbamoyl-phosphate synthase large subunit
MEGISKVLVLGSGAIKIGEAGEFDYSGSQALKALREEGITSILVNPNVATIQTDTRMADKVYFLPVLPEFVAEVIERERPDGIFLAFGGQTALNCGVQLARSGVLDRYGVRVLGTPIEGIEATEDRALFKQAMAKAGVDVPTSREAYSLEEAREIARELGYPVVIRVAFTLGGKGGGVAHNELELDEIVTRGLSLSMIHQVLVEEYVGDWKQVEYEVMRDVAGNSITVCNMENILAMRVHTGDNIVVAPSQTLNNREYHLLRTASIEATKAVGVIGECNIQFALDPQSERFYAIEINARLSRSSALASKATGYPLAYMAAKLALGYTLPELLNKVTGVTTACFEPSLDYVVVKMPRWDLQKFERVNRRIGTQMKSVGEVMAIGRCFEEALQKAVRMLDIGRQGLVADPREGEEVEEPIEHLEEALQNPTDTILFNIVKALKRGLSIERIYRLTAVDPWFLYKIRNLIRMEERLRQEAPEPRAETLREAKRLGFSDAQIAYLIGSTMDRVRALRKRLGIVPVVNQIDTLAAEWPAKTNYLYLTYGGDVDDVEFRRDVRKVIVLGAGTYRIGSSVEFDWCTMNMVWGLKTRGIDEVIVVNCNPETVSTDYDMSDRLYFEELTLERVLDIYEKELGLGVVVSVGGQTPNNLAKPLADRGVPILGTSAESVDRAEDRSKFSRLLDELGIPQPAWSRFTTLEEAEAFAKKVGYPVLVRPSYVLSGAAMRVVWTSKQLKQFLTQASRVSPEHPVVISKFLDSALEVEIDAVGDGERVVVGSIIEHIEKAGVHSGDAIMCAPPHTLPRTVQETIVDYTEKIARALQIKGPFNIQFVVKDGRVHVIECNLRASRSMPFISKLTGINLMDLAAQAILGERLPTSVRRKRDIYGVKVPQFSFTQLEGADILLGVEMRSTGEVACFGPTFYDALMKALIAAGYRIPSSGYVLVTVGGTSLKEEILPIVKGLVELGYRVMATEHTAEFLTARGVKGVETVYKVSEPHRRPNILEKLTAGEIDLIINIPAALVSEKYLLMLEDEYVMRRKAVELGIPVITTLELAKAFLEGLRWWRTHKPTIEILA